MDGVSSREEDEGETAGSWMSKVEIWGALGVFSMSAMVVRLEGVVVAGRVLGGDARLRICVCWWEGRNTLAIAAEEELQPCSLIAS